MAIAEDAMTWSRLPLRFQRSVYLHANQRRTEWSTDTVLQNIHYSNVIHNEAVENPTVRRKVQAPKIVDLEQASVDVGNLVPRNLPPA